MRRTLVGLALTLSLAACSQSTPPDVPTPMTGTKSGTTLTKQDVLTVTPGANDVVTSGKITKAPGQQGAPQISLTATNDDQQNGCNATGNAKATLTMTSSNTAVIAQPAPIQIAGCGTTVPFPYTVASDAPEGAEVVLTVKASGGRGGSYTEASFTVRVIHPKPVDSTAPVVTPTITGTAGVNGWYTGDVTVQWSVEDLESAVSTPECASTTITADTAGQDMSCTATSTGGTTIGKVTVKRDTASPTVTAAPDRAPDAVGWYREPVTFTFTCADATPGSGLADGSCPAPMVVSAESDGSTPAGSGLVTDRAGLIGNTTLSVKLDRTAPTAGITPQGTLVNGWYTSDVTFAVAGTDALSGGVTCTPIAALTSDTAGQDVTTTCTDAAGNSSTAQLRVKRDTTAPQASLVAGGILGLNGWYTTDVTFTPSGSDALSGVTCTTPETLRADSASHTATTTCMDGAGNTSTAFVQVRRDATAPTGATVTPSGTVGDNGWYVSDVTFAAKATDAMSAVSCAPIPALITDTTGTTVQSACQDEAGNVTTASLSVKRDTTAPMISGADVLNTSWRNTDLSADFTASDAVSGLANATEASFTLTVSQESGGLTAPTVVSRTVRDAAGNIAVRSLSALIDRTAPTAGITPQGTLVNGWYTSDVTFAVAGTDALSGGVTCTPIAALTSDTAGQDVTTTCMDAAGNSSTAQLVVKRDATPPTSAEISPSGSYKNGWYTSDVIFSVSGKDALSAVTCTAIPVLSTDTDGTTVQSVCTDQAGNSTLASLSGVKRDTHAPVISGMLDSRVIASSSAGATLNSSMMSASDKAGSLDGSGVSGGVSNGVTCTPTTLKFGDNTVTCTATDNAGNTASNTSSVAVTLDNIFSGTFNLLAPLKSNPADLSLVKQGSTVPVKFMAPSYAGGPATDLAGGLVMKITYRSSATSDTTFEVVDAAASGSTVWRYDAISNQYIFNLSTKTGFAQAGQYDIEISYQGVTVARGAFNLKK